MFFYFSHGKNHEDFGLDLSSDYGTLTYYDGEGHYREETVINGKPQLVTEEQTLTQMKALEEATENLQ